MSQTKKVLLNLDHDIYDPLAADAAKHSVSVTEWLRDAIRGKLKGASAGVTADVQPGTLPLDNPPFDPTPIQTPDMRDVGYWARRIEAWRAMDGKAALAAMLAETGGKRPPAHLFQSVATLAVWLAENVGRESA